MKSFFSLLLTFGLGLAAESSLLAQDAAAPIRRSSPSPGEPTQVPQPEETPRPTPESPRPTPESGPTATPAVAAPEETPAPTATPEQTAVASPESTAPATTPAASATTTEAQTSTPAPRTTAPSRRVINEKPVRAVEPRERRPWDETPGGSAVTRPTFDLSQRAGGGSVGSILRNLERRWQAAIVAGDAEAIGKLIADDFVGTSSTGKVGSRSTLLAAVRRDKNTYKSATARGMTVRSLGPDVAVVTGVATEVGTKPDGERFKVSRRFTDTWRERNGKWQCVASHATSLSKD